MNHNRVNYERNEYHFWYPTHTFWIPTYMMAQTVSHYPSKAQSRGKVVISRPSHGSASLSEGFELHLSCERVIDLFCVTSSVGSRPHCSQISLNSLIHQLVQILKWCSCNLPVDLQPPSLS